MSKLFAYRAEDLTHVKPWLKPATPPTSKADQEQVAKLQEHGFRIIWEPTRAESMHRLGMLQAKTHCDGALWPYQRAQWKDGLARWAFEPDIAFYESLIAALNGGEKPAKGEEGGFVETLMHKLVSRGMKIEPEHLAALEAVARLGTPAQVLTFLETM